MTLQDRFWILQKKDTLVVWPQTLEGTRMASLTAGANLLDTTIYDLKCLGWRAIRVRIDYHASEPL